MLDQAPDKTKRHEEEEVLVAADASQKFKDAVRVTEEAREKEYRQPTFAGQLFMGKFAPELLFPFPFQNETDKKVGDVFVQEIGDYLGTHLDADKVDQEREIPPEVMAQLTKMGVFAMKVPKEYDGLGFSQTNYNRTVMKVASHCGGTAVLISAHQSIGVPQPLRLYGTDAQKKKYLPRFRKGAISAFALTEPDVGSDPAEMSAEAVLSEDGQHYILNGDKLWCTNGTIAEVLVVIAKTAPKMVGDKERKQISAFIVETNWPGVEVVQRCEFMGLGAIYNGMLRFTNVKIPKENLIWAEGRGLAIALGTVNVGRLTLPAACTGAAKQCLSICRRWGLDRVQWGQPIGKHEWGRQKISYIAATTFAMEAVTWLTSSWVDQANIDIRIEAAMAKMFCTEELWKIVDMTMQLRGGRGYEKAASLKARGEPGYAVERMMRDCRINLILEGSSEIMRLFLAREAMDPHLRLVGDLLKKKLSFGQKVKKGWEVMRFYLKWYPTQLAQGWHSSSYKELGSLETHFQFVEKYSHILSRAIFRSMAKHQQKLERKQLLLGRLVEIGTDLFVMAATCSYAIGLQQKQGDDTPIALADYFCTMARRRVEERFAALTNNDDRKSYQLAEQVLDQKMRWLEEGVIWVGPRE